MSMRFFAFDVETPNGANDRICSIGYALIEKDTIIDAGNILIDPECFFDERNIGIHGIHPKDVKGAPRFTEVWPVLKSMMQGSVLIAHNARFDLSVLYKVLWHYQIPTGVYQYVDTLKLTMRGLPYLENHKLNTVCKYLSIPLDHHNSGSDASAAGNILLYIKNKGILNVDQFIDTYDFSIDPNAVRPSHTRISEATRALKELKELLIGITADSNIEQGEFQYLMYWINSHENLNGNYPFDMIFTQIQKILSDGIISADELNELNVLCEELIDPVNAHLFVPAECDIEGKNIVLTGDFKQGSRSEVTALLSKMGANVQNSVTKKTDIVLVGEYGSEAWAMGNYGTKVKKAMELNEKGINISIVREHVFFKIQGE